LFYSRHKINKGAISRKNGIVITIASDNKAMLKQCLVSDLNIVFNDVFGE